MAIDETSTHARYPRARVLAWLIDWACILAWVAVTAGAGIPLYVLGVTRPLSFLALNVVAGAVLIVPVTFALAAFEAATRHASPGKRAMGLTVIRVRSEEPIRFPRALGRNVLKIAVPWTLGHAAVIGLYGSSATGGVAAPIVVVTVIAYLLPIAYVASLFLPGGRTPYDRISATNVIAAARSDGATRRR